MFTVHTRVSCFNGYIHFRTLISSADDIVTFLQWVYLFVSKYIFYNYHTTEISAIGLFIQHLFFTGSLQLGFTYTDAELLLTMFTNEHQRLAFRIFRFIKSDIIVTFGAKNSFHFLSNGRLF